MQTLRKKLDFTAEFYGFLTHPAKFSIHFQSMVTLNSYNKMEEEPATPVRQSKRISARAAAAAGEAPPTNGETNGDSNGHSDVKMADISVAEEAAEPATSENPAGPGFLKKTISRIWGSATTNGASYQEVGGEDGASAAPAPAAEAAPAAENGKSCVIS